MRPILLFVLLMLVWAEGFEFNGKSYTFFPTPATWRDAWVQCTEKGASLLAFQSAAEEDFIEGRLKRQKVDSVWTAGQYRNSYWQWSLNMYHLKGQGCYKDDAGIFTRHDLEYDVSSPGVMTIDFCVTSCRNLGYKYSGLQGGDQCYCGGNDEKFGKQGPAQGCHTPCQNNPKERCGGTEKNYIYSNIPKKYSNWYNDHPESISKQCVAMMHLHEFQWLESSCFDKKAYVCQQNIPKNSDKECRFKPISYKFCVSVSKSGESATWFEARERCSLLGSDVNLVTVDNPGKQLALADYLGKRLKRQEDFWIGATRNKMLWARSDGKDYRYYKVYVSRIDPTSAFAANGALIFHQTPDGYRLKDSSPSIKEQFICETELPTTTGKPTTTTVAATSEVTSPLLHVTSTVPLETTMFTTVFTTNTLTVKATSKASTTGTTTTGNKTAPGINASQQQGGDDPDQIMLAIIIACVGGVVIIIIVIVAVVWIRKRERKAAKKREKAFKIKYAPSIHDLDRRSANIMDARVTIQQAEDNDYCDPESAVDENKADTSDDTVVNRKRAQVTNKARMRAIQDTYDVPKPRMSQIPPAPEPVGVDQRAPVAVPADVAAKIDALNQGQDANRDTDHINTSGDDTEEEYSYAYAGFAAPPEPKVKDTGKTSYNERLIN